MSRRFFLFSLLVISMGGSALCSHQLIKAYAASLTGEMLVLYDASTGSIPSEALMDFVDFPPGASVMNFAGDATVLDTTSPGSDTYAGWVSSQATTAGFPALDRTAGIQVNFTLQVESESHSNSNRSGFSAIVLDQNAKGIEISFWKNEVWVQNDDATGGLFTRGESAAFSTTTGLIDYQVTILGDTYTLTADSQPLLTGPVRDYSNFQGFPNPYLTPNFLFLGDDTTSGQSRVRLRFLSVTGTEPVIPTPAITATNTSNPSPTASFTPLPTVTPSPSPTPAGGVPGLCPSGWLPMSVVVGSILLKKLRR